MPKRKSAVFELEWNCLTEKFLTLFLKKKKSNFKAKKENFLDSLAACVKWKLNRFRKGKFFFPTLLKRVCLLKQVSFVNEITFFSLPLLNWCFWSFILLICRKHVFFLFFQTVQIDASIKIKFQRKRLNKNSFFFLP